MKVTIAQIAKAAGVSPGSVSNALNNRKGTISEQKREHIIRIAEQLGYFKKENARALFLLCSMTQAKRSSRPISLFSRP